MNIVISAALNQTVGITLASPHKYSHNHTWLYQNYYIFCPQLVFKVFIQWYCFLGVFCSSLLLHLNLSVTFPPGWCLFIILYKGTRRGQATQSQGQAPRASRIVWTRAKPQTTEHDMKALHIFGERWPDSVPISFSLLIHAFTPPFCEVLTVQSGPTVEENALDFIVSTHYDPPA